MSGGSRVYQTSSSPPIARKLAEGLASRIATDIGPAVRPAAVPAQHPHHQHDPWLRNGFAGPAR
jgi:hypothetical protein